MSADVFSVKLLEEAKRFAERFHESHDKPEAFLHASLVLGMCSLESHVNSICEDFLVSDDLGAWDRSILSERSVEIEDGEFVVTSRLKMQRLEDRILFLCKRFSKSPIDRTSSYWAGFREATALRNKLVHPKGEVTITYEQVARCLNSILEVLNHLFLALYKQPHPAGKRGMQSTLTF